MFFKQQRHTTRYSPKTLEQGLENRPPERKGVVYYDGRVGKWRGRRGKIDKEKGEADEVIAVFPRKVCSTHPLNHLDRGRESRQVNA